MKIIVSDKWLGQCGNQHLSGVELEVTRVQPMRGEEKMYYVRLPSGSEWAVWNIRGVEVKE